MTRKNVKQLLAKYYKLRRQTYNLGFTDRDFPRYHKRIKFEEDITEKDFKRILACIEEERAYLRTYERYTALDKEATERERSQQR